MQRRQHGFTLIELMMTVAIIGIMAAIVIPSYSDYTIRARVSESIVAAAPCKLAVSEVQQIGGGSFAVQPDGWGCNEGRLQPTQFVNVIHTDAAGAITVTLNPTDTRLGGAMGKDIILVPVFASGGNLNAPATPGATIYGWICRPGATMPLEFVPSSCRT